MLKDFTKESFDIIVQAGQSNSSGTGYGDASDPYVPSDEVWYFTGDFNIENACECVEGNQISSNFALSFSKEYLDHGLLKGGRKLLILRTAVGATGFLDHRWGENDDLFLRMMEMIRLSLEMNQNNRLVAFLWHQGETDALLGASYQTHFNNLSTLLTLLSKRYKCENIPFIAGDFVKHWKDENQKCCKPVVKAIQDAFCSMPNGNFVYTDELQSNAQVFDCDDIIHFSRESLYELGRKYFKVFYGSK